MCAALGIVGEGARIEHPARRVRCGQDGCDTPGRSSPHIPPSCSCSTAIFAKVATEFHVDPGHS